ncbi:MAG: hypothetical protein ACJ8D2_09695, partial [Sphingomicrobium sp.]
ALHGGNAELFGQPVVRNCVENRGNALLAANRSQHGKQILDADAALILHQLISEIEDYPSSELLANAWLLFLLLKKMPEHGLMARLALLVTARTV